MKSDNVKNVRIRFKRDTEVIVVTSYDGSTDNILEEENIIYDNQTIHDVCIVGCDSPYPAIDIEFADGSIAFGFNPSYIDIIPFKSFVIMRGCPGSGKSTLAKKIAGDNGKIFSADNVLIEDGVYRWNIDRAKEAHRKAREGAMYALLNDEDIIIIDNTNTTVEEMANFQEHIEYAQGKGYEVLIIEPNTAWSFDADVLNEKNTHNVPMKSIKKMIARYQKNVTVEDIISFRSKVIIGGIHTEMSYEEIQRWNRGELTGFEGVVIPVKLSSDFKDEYKSLQQLIDEEPDNLKDLIDGKTFLEVYIEGNNAMPIPNP